MIYASGGFKAIPHGNLNVTPSKKVFYFDTRHPEDGWIAATPMNNARMLHYMLADADKIYVLGGYCMLNSDEEQLFAEVYDPNSNTWKGLAGAPFVDGDFRVPTFIEGHAVVDSEDKIVFYSYFNGSMYYLDTRNKDEMGVHSEEFGRCHTKSACLDGVLYFLDRNGIYAYEISTCRFYDKAVDLQDVGIHTLPRRDVSDSRTFAYLLSLGHSYLALIWTQDPEYFTAVDIHCSILEMSKDGDSIVGRVVNCFTHSVDGGLLRGCLAVPSLDKDVGVDAKLGQKTESSNKQRKSKRKRSG